MTTDIIYNIIKNKYYFILFKQYFNLIRPSLREEWRYKYDQWSNLSDLVTHKHINLLRYRLKRGDQVDVSVESIKLFCENVKDDVELFRLVYERYRDYFLSPDLLLIVTAHGNLEIVKLLAHQTTPITLMRTKHQFTQPKKQSSNEYHHDNILTRAFKMNHFHIYFYLLDNVFDEDGKSLRDSFKYRLDELIVRDPKRITELLTLTAKGISKSIKEQHILEYLFDNKNICHVVGDVKLLKKLGVKVQWSQEQYDLAYEIARLHSMEFQTQSLLHNCDKIPFSGYQSIVLNKLLLANKRLSELGFASHVLKEDSDRFKQLMYKFIIIEELERKRAMGNGKLIENIIKECLATGEPLSVYYLMDDTKEKQLKIFHLLIKCQTSTNHQWIVAIKINEISNILTQHNVHTFINVMSEVDYISQERIELLLPTISKVISSQSFTTISAHLLKIVDLYFNHYSIIIKNINRLKVLVDYDTLADFLAKYNGIVNLERSNEAIMYFISDVCTEVYQLACRNGRLDYVVLVIDKLNIQQITDGLNYAVRGRHLHVFNYIIENFQINLNPDSKSDLIIDLLKTDDTSFILDIIKLDETSGLNLKRAMVYSNNTSLFIRLQTSAEAFFKLIAIFPQIYRSTHSPYTKIISNLIGNNQLNRNHWSVLHKYYDRFESIINFQSMAVEKAIEYDNVKLLSLIYEKNEDSKKYIEKLIPLLIDTIIKNKCLAILSFIIKNNVKLHLKQEQLCLADSTNASLYVLLKKHTGQYIKIVNNRCKFNY